MIMPLASRPLGTPDKGLPMRNDVINRLTASTYIIDAVIKELSEDTPIFESQCQNYNNLSEAIISAYQKLGFRERDMIAKKLGFAMDTFAPAQKLPYHIICVQHELCCAGSASRIVKKALRKIAMEIILENQGEEV